MKLFVKIPEDKIDKDIRFLIIESDDIPKGFFLFFHKTLETPCEADLWFKDLEGAKRQATFNYGINPNDWEMVEL